MIKNGRLPWATDSTYRALVQNFKKKEWKNAMLTAAYLGHYVGDGHMPLHLTNNYDGKLTSQSGIHSRYESTMINKFITEINYKSSKVKKIKDVRSYIFNISMTTINTKIHYCWPITLHMPQPERIFRSVLSKSLEKHEGFHN